MLDTAVFFETQIKQCAESAERSSNNADREFWLKMADRWTGLLQARQPLDTDNSTFVQKFGVNRIAKRRRAALVQSRH